MELYSRSKSENLKLFFNYSLALNFTGCTTFTSRTGVKKEIFKYVPTMALMVVSGISLSILLHWSSVKVRNVILAIDFI